MKYIIDASGEYLDDKTFDLFGVWENEELREGRTEVNRLLENEHTFIPATNINIITLVKRLKD